VLFWVELATDLKELALVSPRRENVLHHLGVLGLCSLV
jgi:hypothetical protein